MYENELQHHGVKGMKWGVRKAERSLVRKYRKLGRIQGEADYYKEKSREIGSSYDKKASVLDKEAAMYKSQGSAVKAAKMTAKANAIRNQKKAATADYDALFERYKNKETVMKAKITDTKTKKNARLGKARIDVILSKSRTKTYNKRVSAERFARTLEGVSAGIEIARGVQDAKTSYQRKQQQRQ